MMEIRAQNEHGGLAAGSRPSLAQFEAAMLLWILPLKLIHRAVRERGGWRPEHDGRNERRGAAV